MEMYHDKKNPGAGKYRKYPLGYHVGGQCHGGTVVEEVSAKGAYNAKTPYPLDTSDFNGGAAEMRPEMPQFASGDAGGYGSNTSGHNKS